MNAYEQVRHGLLTERAVQLNSNPALLCVRLSLDRSSRVACLRRIVGIWVSVGITLVAGSFFADFFMRVMLAPGMDSASAPCPNLHVGLVADDVQVLGSANEWG
eukprot:4691979-Pyramimonas_sp.AAC.1